MADRDTTGTGGPNRKASAPTDRLHDHSDRANRDRGPDRSADLDRMAAEARDTVEHGFNAQGRIRSLLEQQTHRAADQLGGVANALRKAAEQLSEENNGTAARYADQAADRVGRVADLLRESTVDDMVNGVERFARRQPEVFVGAAFTLGFLAARFLKSSGERRGGPASAGDARFQDARFQGGPSYQPGPRVTGRAGHTNAATAAAAAAHTTGAVSAPVDGPASKIPASPAFASSTPASQTPAAKLGSAPSGTGKPQDSRP